MARDSIADMDDFTLGTPALVCRWRLAQRRLPLENRHLRALLARRVQGKPVSTELAAWAKQHLEWTLDKGAAEHPDGVLMLLIDRSGRAAMTVGPYEPLDDTKLAALERRARQAQREARDTCVAPETLWLAHDDLLMWDPGEPGSPAGATSLVAQLAQTVGIPVSAREGLLDELAAGDVSFDEAFLVSDEHGVVPAADAAGTLGARMQQSYQRLLQQ